MDWERFDKDEGDPSVESESQVENRTTLLASYSFAERYMVVARLPYSVRDLEGSAAGEESERTRTHGFSDPEVYGQVRLWSSPLAEGIGRRASISLSTGVKTPWGQNDVTQAGVRVDEHAQPGTGSTDFFGGPAFLCLTSPQSSLFASTSYRHTGHNQFGYRYGSTFMANLACEYKLTRIFDAVVELNFRHAEKDQVNVDGTTDDDTGGSLLYATPRLLVPLPGGTVLRIASQIPVVRDLNGFQEERAVVNVGVTRLFAN